MKRRNFIKTATAGSLPVMLGGFPLKAIGKNSQMAALTNAAENSDRVLVLIQLNGGNDGLNTVIPLDQYPALNRARGKLLIPEEKVIPVYGDTGFHPNFGEMNDLFLDRKLAVVQSVGYPDPNFSHFRATDIWTSGSASSEVLTSGWMGRYLDQEYPGFPDGFPNAEMPDPLAITIGSVLSSTCQGETTNLGMAITSPHAFSQLLTGDVENTPNTPYGHELTFLRHTMRQTNLYLEVIQQAATNAINKSRYYPPVGQNSIADQLRIVAQLIAGGLKTRVYIVSLGGFDTHANQQDPDNPTLGRHPRLLQRLSQAIFAFQDDLEQFKIDDRVVGMTFSEFGRRIVANASLGTDHGSAAPLFVFGKNVNALFFGQNPEIPAYATPKDNLPMQYDFRSVYGSVLMDWFNVDENVIQDLLFDDFQHVPVIKNSNYVPQEGDLFLMQNYPNPFNGVTFIPFRTGGGRIKASIYDTSGREVRELTNRTFDAGEYELVFDSQGLGTGVYYCRIQQGDQQAVKSMMRQ